jgi:non-ribosomal peptide synthetase component F
MCVIRVGGETAEFIQITVSIHDQPGAGAYWDGNWVRAEVEVAAGGFQGRVAGNLWLEELVSFRNQLSRLLDTFSGSAEFQTMERWLSLRVTSDRRGHLTLAAEIRDEPAGANVLSCRLEYDQTYFRPMFADLSAAVDQLIAVGQRRTL